MSLLSDVHGSPRSSYHLLSQSSLSVRPRLALAAISAIGVFAVLIGCSLKAAATTARRIPGQTITNADKHVPDVEGVETSCSPGPLVRWMWADASIIGHWAAELDPFRWSSWETHSQLTKELRGYSDSTRPVEIQMGAHRDSWKSITKTYASVKEAIGQVGTFQPDDFRLPRMPQKPMAGHLVFDEDMSRRLSLVSKATYTSDVEVLSNWTCTSCRDSGLTVVPKSGRHFGSSSHLSGFVFKLQGQFGQTCLLALRGTGNENNVWADLDEWQSKLPEDWRCPSCYAHTGFLKYWTEIEPSAVDALKASSCDNAGLLITGHSLGGALATLGAWSLQQKHGYQLSAIYTYESPRVATTEFADAWDSKIAATTPAFRVTSENDPVVQIPCFWGHFVHVQHEVRYCARGGFRIIAGRECPCDESEALSSMAKDNWSEHCHLPYAADICGDDTSLATA